MLNKNRDASLSCGLHVQSTDVEKGMLMWKYESYMEEIGSERSELIGKHMTADRKAAGYTIRELAEKIDMSPTHLNRMEKGQRLMDSVSKLINFCEACHVPIEKYLVLCGMHISEEDTPIRRAFPAIENEEQENAIDAFAKMITSKKLTSEDITQILNTAIAYADFCDKKNQ